MSVNDEEIKTMVKDLAEKYNLVQQTDIDKVENAVYSRENVKNYLKLDGRKFILIDKYFDRTEIVLGKINIIMEDIDEEEVIWIDTEKNKLFKVKEYNDITNLFKEIEEILKND